MKRIAATLALTGLLASGCADDSGSIGPAPTRATTAPAPPTRPRVPVPATPGARAVLYETWFAKDGRLVRTLRTGTAGVRGVAARALASLTAGPAAEEEASGLSTELGAGDRLAIANISSGLATVRADPSFFGGGRSSQRLRQAQVVFTLTQYPTVRRVRFVPTGGAPARTLTRLSFEEVLPAIVVDEPRPGASTPSPVTIAGDAGVFEGTVSIRILDAAGTEIARTFTTATCGSGCRGAFTASVRYAVDRTQDGTIEVFEVSAKDGSAQDIVAVPVRLTRSAPAPAG